MKRQLRFGLVTGCLIFLAAAFSMDMVRARPLQAVLGTGFTYQGRLNDGGVLANGTYDFTFALYDDPTAGAQVGATVTRNDVTVSDGLFTVTLDFGAVFDGTALYLEIAVRPGSSTGAYTTLTPRQPLTAVPYASYAAKAPWSRLSGVPAGFADGVDNHILAGLTCANGQVAQWNGSAWTCAAAGGNGDITAVNAGTGLTGGGASGDVTLAADTNYLRRRVTGACPAGQYLKAINVDGSVVCASPTMTAVQSFCQRSYGDNYGDCSASCSTGWIRVGGGCETEYPTNGNFMLTKSMPAGPDGWMCTYARVLASGDWWIKAYVTCLQVP